MEGHLVIRTKVVQRQQPGPAEAPEPWLSHYVLRTTVPALPLGRGSVCEEAEDDGGVKS